MKEKLLIIGASGHGKVVADIAKKINKWKDIVFLDDDENIKFSMGVKVIGKSVDLYKYLNEYDFIVGIGSNTIREEIQLKLEAAKASIASLIHPTAVIGEQVKLSNGTVVMAGAVINCCTKLGKGCIVNTGATVDHDNIIEDYVHISPGTHLAGSVKVGKGTWLGIGSIVSNNINIISGCKVGAGAVVVNDITETGTYIGIPARRV
ncbi:acetyltransferase [Sporosarcina trichiuri]|uniref:acetyltransferase n=1 Tax=Sporosarcina trichiuri TaxID=3056445 RepID=UPI0025B56591|nr:acetyltransferase [Sporosarcina sp. 0.2-SM1T-5]WJY26420.1 acetyltransferase [Sporosarcina sp. 0.2-SM1T-5]